VNQTCNLRSTATVSSMNAQPVGPQRLIYVDIFYALYTNWLIAFLERMSANSNAQFGVINQQQPLAFNHHPRHLSPPTPGHHHPQQPLLLTATINRLQPRHTTNNGTTNSNVATPHHEPQRPPVQPQTMKNTWKWTQTTPLLTNNGQHPWTDTRDDKPRSDSSPSPYFNPLIWNPGAMSPSAMWQPNNVWWPRFVIRHCCVVRAPWWVPPSIHPNPPCSHTAQQWTNNVGQWQCS